MTLLFFAIISVLCEMRWSRDVVRRPAILDLVHRNANFLELIDRMVSVQRPRHRRRRGLQPVVPVHAGGGECARFRDGTIPAPGGKRGGIAQIDQNDLPPTSHSNLDSLLVIPYGTAVMLATPDRRRQLSLLSIFFGESTCLPCVCTDHFLTIS